MTREDSIRKGREAGWREGFTPPAALYRFAALVAAAEREACADICDQHASVEGIAQRCAEQIRGRGKA